LFLWNKRKEAKLNRAKKSFWNVCKKGKKPGDNTKCQLKSKKHIGKTWDKTKRQYYKRNPVFKRHI